MSFKNSQQVQMQPVRRFQAQTKPSSGDVTTSRFGVSGVYQSHQICLRCCLTASRASLPSDTNATQPTTVFDIHTADAHLLYNCRTTLPPPITLLDWV